VKISFFPTPAENQQESQKYHKKYFPLFQFCKSDIDKIDIFAALQYKFARSSNPSIWQSRGMLPGTKTSSQASWHSCHVTCTINI
jgi:hypothetical protein